MDICFNYVILKLCEGGEYGTRLLFALKLCNNCKMLIIVKVKS